MKLFSPFFTLCLLFSCTPELEPNQRILVKGIVLDSEGQALGGHEVQVYSEVTYGYFVFFYSRDEYLLGSGQTEPDGSFSVTSLSDKDRNFSVFIDGQELYSDYQYVTETLEYPSSESSFDIGTVNLKDKATLNFSITRTSPSGTNISYSLTYQIPGCSEVYQDGVLNTELSDCYSEQVIGNMLNENNPDEAGQLETTLGSVVTFSYSINEQPTITETFIIDQPNYTYEFTY